MQIDKNVKSDIKRIISEPSDMPTIYVWELIKSFKSCLIQWLYLDEDGQYHCESSARIDYVEMLSGGYMISFDRHYPDADFDNNSENREYAQCEKPSAFNGNHAVSAYKSKAKAQRVFKKIKNLMAEQAGQKLLLDAILDDDITATHQETE